MPVISSAFPALPPHPVVTHLVEDGAKRRVALRRMRLD
jgi:hypothetical protein